MDRCINFSMRKANRVLNQIYDNKLAECGLKGGQFSMLRVIHRLKETTNSELQDVMIVDQTTLTRGLKPLIRDGYVQTRPGTDQRVKLLSLTSEGEALCKRATKHWEEAQKMVAQRLGEDTVQQLFALSDSVVSLKI